MEFLHYIYKTRKCILLQKMCEIPGGWNKSQSITKNAECEIKSLKTKN